MSGTRFRFLKKSQDGQLFYFLGRKLTFCLTLCPSSQIFTGDQTHFLNDPLSVVTDFVWCPISLFIFCFIRLFCFSPLSGLIFLFSYFSLAVGVSYVWMQ